MCGLFCTAEGIGNYFVGGARFQLPMNRMNADKNGLCKWVRVCCDSTGSGSWPVRGRSRPVLLGPDVLGHNRNTCDTRTLRKAGSPPLASPEPPRAPMYWRNL